MIPKQRVNMADVAQRCGVSIATVSRALRGESGVSAATRDRIMRIAEDLSYVVSPEASTLSGGSTGRVGVVVPRVDAWFYSVVLAGIAEVFATAGLDLVLCPLPDSAARHRFFETLPLQRKVDAVIVVAAPLSAREHTRLNQLGVPMVQAGGDDDGVSPWVGIDDELAARQAVGHLLRIGHRDIAMIQALDSEGVAWAADRARVRGFHGRLAEDGITDPMTVSVPWGIDGGAQGMEELLSRARVPTAVFCHSDEIAVGALRTLRRAGITVPRDISVIGVDDHPVADVADLTTVGQETRRQGVIAAELLIRRLDGAAPVPGHPRVTVLPTRLVIRGSTMPPAGSRDTHP
ncbi:MAG: LacI family DNA-binding transcriptional regulator [Actinobacteria bacterium]|nr:LacI family DNA-binding transcriptional regulator [Actinomycetota bacterium]MBS1900324.1 LacI family DNA-binding transcriptional regulator [Actinomycetota bacterium]